MFTSIFSELSNFFTYNPNNDPDLNSNPNDTKFYYLSLIKEQDGYSIHGLWPQTNKTTYPSFCRDVTFDASKLTDILPELEKYWYSNQGDGGIKFDEIFWKHEYEKHGSCVFTEISEHDYFAKTLELYYKAITDDLPDKYYNNETKKCLIPVSLDFEFMG